MLPVNGALLLALAFYWFNLRPLPNIGGGQPPNRAAWELVKQGYAAIPREEETGFARLNVDRTEGWLSIFEETPQSLRTYQLEHPIRPTPERRTIAIQPLGPMSTEEKKIVEAMREYAEIYFQLPARLAAPRDLKRVEDEARGNGAANHMGGKQYNSGSILHRVLKLALPTDAMAHFGVTAVDLYTRA